MITAEEAKAKTKERLDELYKNELIKVELAIEEAINEGEYSCYIANFWISTTAKNELEKLGYEVERHTFQEDSDDSYSIIRW